MARVTAFDGISGSGKTTTAGILWPYLLRKGCKIFVINEKEYEPFRSWIISWHKRPVEERVFEWQDIIDVAKVRAVVHASLAPTIAQSDIALFDRSLYTSAVYQSSASISPREIIEVNLSFGAIEPEVVFLFLGNAEVCHGRILERSKKKSSYNLPAMVETPEQLQEYQKGYIVLSKLLKNAVLINARLPTAAKAKAILAVLRNIGL